VSKQDSARPGEETGSDYVWRRSIESWHMGSGQVFADRDVVAVPEWAIALRRQVEDLGLAPGMLLSLLGAVAETRKNAAACEEAAEALVDAVHPVIPAETSADYFGMVRAAVATAANPATAKTDPGDDRARERVAAWVGSALALVIGGKSCTGGALLSALRHGAAVLVAVGTGERDDHDAEEGAGNASRPPAHLRRNERHEHDRHRRERRAERAEMARQLIEALRKERDDLIKAVADHVTVRGQYYAENERLRGAAYEALAADDAMCAFLLAAEPKEIGEAAWGAEHKARRERRQAATSALRAALARKDDGNANDAR
jgi:hypothetical protein